MGRQGRNAKNRPAGTIVKWLCPPSESKGTSESSLNHSLGWYPAPSASSRYRCKISEENFCASAFLRQFKQMWLYPLKAMLDFFFEPVPWESWEGFKQALCNETYEWMEPQVMCRNKSVKAFITPVDSRSHHPAQDCMEKEERRLIIHQI